MEKKISWSDSLRITIYDMQKNIARILDILIRDYKVDLVAIEGKEDGTLTINFSTMSCLSNEDTIFFPIENNSVVADLEPEGSDRTADNRSGKYERIGLFKIMFNFMYYPMLDIPWQFKKHLFCLFGEVIRDHLSPIFFFTVAPDILPDLRDFSSDSRNSEFNASISSSISTIVSLSNIKPSVCPFLFTRRIMPFNENGNLDALDRSKNTIFSSANPFNNGAIIFPPSAPYESKYNTLVSELSSIRLRQDFIVYEEDSI